MIAISVANRERPRMGQLKLPFRSLDSITSHRRYDLSCEGRVKTATFVLDEGSCGCRFRRGHKSDRLATWYLETRKINTGFYSCVKQSSAPLV